MLNCLFLFRLFFFHYTLFFLNLNLRYSRVFLQKTSRSNSKTKSVEPEKPRLSPTIQKANNPVKTNF